MDDGFQPTVCGPKVPTLLELFCRFRRSVLKLTEGQTNLVRFCGLSMLHTQGVESLLLGRRQALGIHEPQIPGFLGGGVTLLFVTPYVVYGIPQQLTHMERIKGYLGLWKHRRDPSDDCLGDVVTDDFHLLRFSAVFYKVLVKSLNGIRPGPLAPLLALHA